MAIKDEQCQKREICRRYKNNMCLKSFSMTNFWDNKGCEYYETIERLATVISQKNRRK